MMKRAGEERSPQLFLLSYSWATPPDQNMLLLLLLLLCPLSWSVRSFSQVTCLLLPPKKHLELMVNQNIHTGDQKVGPVSSPPPQRSRAGGGMTAALFLCARQEGPSKIRFPQSFGWTRKTGPDAPDRAAVRFTGGQDSLLLV